MDLVPYHDIAGTCGRDEDCVCLSCWVRKVKEERQSRIAATPQTSLGGTGK